jgi:Rrf2 family protein
MLSRKAKYGLKAVLSLASDPQARPAVVASLAEREAIPRKFLEQILLELKHRGLLQSRRGKGGGYQLTRPPDRLAVGEVIRALDGPLAPVPCVSQTAYVKCDECGDEETCGIRLVMKEVHAATTRILDSTSVADVLRSVAAATAVRVAGVPVRVPARGALRRPDAAVPFPQTRRKA